MTAVAQPVTMTTTGDWIQPVPDLIDPLGITGWLAGQWLYLPAVSAAFILQGMHPVIGDVTDRYSVADRDPAGRAIRSFDATQQWSYGGKAAIEQGYWLRKMHRPLQMTAETGPKAGKHISALDPSAYAWVIATAYVTTRQVAPLFLGRALTEDENEQLFADNVRLAKITQVPESGYPKSRAEFDDYYQHMLDEVLVLHPALAESLPVLSNPALALDELDLGGFPRWVPRTLALGAMKWLLQPLGTFSHALTFGAMDPQARAILDVTWTRRDDRVLRRLFAVYRILFRVLPERLTYSPLAYYARRHQRVIERMRNRELRDFTQHDKGEPSAVRRSRARRRAGVRTN
ncbi:MAG: oxygenase MpaB family protein [Gordonia amarae]